MRLAPLGPRRLMWLLIGPLSVVVAIGGALLWAGGQNIQSQRVLHAALRPQTTPVSVVLPQGAHLETIIVSEGEVIRPGQALARLDHAAAQAELKELELDLLVARYERHCLLHPGAEPFLDSVQDWLTTETPDAELSARVRSAHAACVALSDQLRGEEEALSAAMEVLTERRRLLAQALSPPKSLNAPVSGPATTKDGVQLLLALNDLDARLAATQAQINSLKQTQGAERVAALEDVNDRISILLSKRSYATALQGRTSLTSEVGGIVTRVRNPGSGHIARQPITILEISRSEDSQFVLEVLGDQSGFATLAVGLPVQVRLSWPGFDEAAYDGTLVASKNPVTGQEQSGYSVALSDAATRNLQEATGSFLVAGADKRAAAVVDLGPTPMEAVARREAASIWSTTFAYRSFSIGTEVPDLDRKAMARPGLINRLSGDER